jgi:hypothetical protein
MFTATCVLAYPSTGHPVHATVAEQLRAALAPHARIAPVESADGLADRGVLRIAVHDNDAGFVTGPDTPPGGDWMYARIADGVAS